MVIRSSAPCAVRPMHFTAVDRCRLCRLSFLEFRRRAIELSFEAPLSLRSRRLSLVNPLSHVRWRCVSLDNHHNGANHTHYPRTLALHLCRVSAARRGLESPTHVVITSLAPHAHTTTLAIAPRAARRHIGARGLYQLARSRTRSPSSHPPPALAAFFVAHTRCPCHVAPPALALAPSLPAASR